MKVVYINLNRREDRRQHMEQQLPKYFHTFSRFQAIEQSPGIVGCGKSHLEVLRQAYQENTDVLIFEDDFEFLVSPDDFNKLLKSVEGLNYDVIMLSYNLFQSGRSEYKTLGKVIEAQTASGYIVAKEYLQILIKLYEWAIPMLEKTGEHWTYANDQIWKLLQKRDRWYYFLTRVGKQMDGYSDNSLQYENYGC